MRAQYPLLASREAVNSRPEMHPGGVPRRPVPPMKSPTALLAAVSLLLPHGPALHAADSPALGLARQLNQAFVEVADTVSPSVVVLAIARKRPG